MVGIEDYLQWRNDVPFSLAPFNDADNAVLAELAYLNFGDLIEDGEDYIPLAEAAARYIAKHDDLEQLRATAMYGARAPLLLDEMVEGCRFANLKVGHYVDVLDAQRLIQLSAVVFRIDDALSYVSFRGTDDTLIGWQEDFLLSFQDFTEGSNAAAQYLNEVARKLPGQLLVGGHSKGGNFAMYASAFCDADVQARIIKVYNNDGPGFRKEILESEEYRAICSRIVSIVPAASVVGLLMGNDAEVKVVQSSASGFLQHDILTWEVSRHGFVPAELTPFSTFVQSSLGNWLEGTDDATRESVVSTVFSLISATGVETVSAFSAQRFRNAEKVLRGLYSLDAQERETLVDALKVFIRSSRVAAIEELRGLTA